MSLMKKILIVGMGTMAALSICLFVLYGFNDRQNNIIRYEDKARTICLLTESVRNEMEKKWRQGIFTPELMRAFADRGKMENVLSMVPVVSAWQAAYERADAMSYAFKVPKFSPRNPKNQPDQVETEVLNTLRQNNIDEMVYIDKAANTVRFFRAVRLTDTCLLCHGDPGTSQALWGNGTGTDPTGGKMENWKTGEIHGAFEVIQSLTPADAQLKKNLLKAGLVAIIGILITLLIFVVVVRQGITGPIGRIIADLNQGAGQVSEASAHVSSSSQLLAEGASDQAASIEETSSSMEEMTAMTRQNAENASRAEELMTLTSDLVADASSSMAKLTLAMAQISKASEETASIIKTIDEIAFQTNLLALNAAVEAARAGEAGAGFAVVADEVRSLAQRSAAAARDTADIIQDTVEQVTQGEAIVSGTQRAVTDVSESAGKIAVLISEITQASRDQAEGISQVNTAVTKMDKVVQQNAATAEESASAAEELNAQAQTMKSLMQGLASLIRGRKKHSG